MQIRSNKSGLWVALGVLAFLIVCLLGPFAALFNESSLTTFFKHLGFFAAPLFVLFFTLATSLGFPGNVLSVAAGAVFGLVWGTVWSVIGATLGATGAFWLARNSLRQWVERRFGHHPMLQRLNQAIAHTPLNFVMAVRFTPLSPFSLVNFLFGLTPVNLKTYVMGTFLGIIPLSFTYSWLGVAGKQALNGGDRLPLVLALSVLSLLSLLPVLRRKSSHSG
jgi:uncharacterized membrane protein YdjX (TVP38/TMEM64 family)